MNNADGNVNIAQPNLIFNSWKSGSQTSVKDESLTWLFVIGQKK